ncbi:MAG: hypothetical protein A3C15_01185 [Candidatus Magasanikbacteria bacterium RIFCSPHIGHO2_02_FULL_50_9b]|uniref:Uncharacterized protein n=1 Tax=Candidatus Magasanikbacteria bacterium RIFCSPHIGHO2_02_FULL_50_9b TaxID=1798682 RepID=A0A1F6M9D0_9BACT|nr:MAG: hypothetical protein A3C15_01185 [Candidatus Magasanikbacteria bacterium RIFCSPHIGHO2_02_FULL_50_9b]
MPDFEKSGKPENISDVSQLVEASKQELGKLITTRDTLASRIAKAPEGVRAAMQSSIDGLTARIAKQEAMLQQFEKPAANSESVAAQLTGTAQRDRVAAALRRPSIIVSPEVLVAGQQAQMAADQARIDQEYNAQSAADKTFYGQVSTPKPSTDLQRAA